MRGIALVTGAAQGIGAAVARTLAREGAAVVAVDLNVDAVSRLSDELVAAGHRSRPYQVDVRNTAAVDAVVASVESDFGPIRTLVNVAGVLRCGPVTDLSDEDWSDVFDTNTAGVFRFCLRQCAPDRRCSRGINHPARNLENEHEKSRQSRNQTGDRGRSSSSGCAARSHRAAPLRRR